MFPPGQFAAANYSTSLITYLTVQGICMPGGICKCYEGYVGKGCSVALGVSGCSLTVSSLVHVLVMVSFVVIAHMHL